jgi:serine protease
LARVRVLGLKLLYTTPICAQKYFHDILLQDYEESLQIYKSLLLSLPGLLKVNCVTVTTFKKVLVSSRCRREGCHEREGDAIMLEFCKRLIFLGLIIVLVACNSGGGPDDFTISGTVTAPGSGNVQGTIVGACYKGSCTDNRTRSVTITESGTSATFSIDNLEDSTYSIVAVKDTNGNDEVDNGDYGAALAEFVTPPASNVNVLLEVIGGGGTGSSSISGLLISPGGIGDSGTSSNATQPKINRELRNNLYANEAVSVVPGEVIVKFKSGLRVQSLSAGDVQLQRVRSLSLNAFSLSASNLSGVQLYRFALSNVAGSSEAETRRVVEALRARSDVDFAYPNWILHAYKTPDDELYPLQWHYPAMNLPSAWDIEDGTENEVVVSVVDTGITEHPDLLLQTLPGYDFVDNVGISGDGDGRDDDPNDEGVDSDYHGSHVAGTVAASSDDGAGVAGVNWGARIVPVRALGTTGGGSLVDILEGTLWAAGASIDGIPDNPNPARVINLSLGGDLGEPCPDEINIFADLAAAGIITVAAAGNENVDAETSFPASCDGVITVGATGPLGERAPYSNFGTVIDIMAPGGDVNQTIEVGGEDFPAGVLSTIKDDESGDFIYAFYQGTSMASPHVAGLVSLMLAVDPGLSFDEVVTALQNASTPLSGAECDRPSGDECGAGLIDAARALGGEGGNPTPPPTGQLTTYVAAFYCLDTFCNRYDRDLSILIAVEQTQSRTPYTVPGLTEGSYEVAAWQDLNDNQNVDQGEPIGAYPDLVPLNDGQNIGGVTIEMEPYSPSSQSGSIRQNFMTIAKHQETFRTLLQP